MNPSSLLRSLAIFAILASAALGKSPASLTASVHSKTLNGYHRTKGVDGKFRPETYALSNGGFILSTVPDPSTEKVSASQVAAVLGPLLAQQNYHLAQDAKSADLLIVFYWGRTVPFVEVEQAAAIDRSGLSAAELEATYRMLAMQNRARDGITGQTFHNWENGYQARLLGYTGEIPDEGDLRRLTAAANTYDTLRVELEMPRYYIIVRAYDFRETVQRNNRKLLWETRISIRAQKNAFDRDFTAMLVRGAKHFGEDSVGLLRRSEREGRVDIGDMEVLGVSPTAVPQPSKESEEKEHSPP